MAAEYCTGLGALAEFQADGSSLAPPGHACAVKVLVAADQTVLRALGINLRARRYEVAGASTGQEALAVAASHPPPDAIILDLGSHQVTRAAAAAQSSGPAQTLRLTPTEWAILELLVQRPGQLVGSAQLLVSVWGPGFERHSNYLRFHMARLRRKLEDDPASPRHLLTERGMGYRYLPQARPVPGDSRPRTGLRST